MTDNPRNIIGGNNPPPDPIAELAAIVDNAVHFLDGAKVDNKPLADKIGKLVDLLREGIKTCDAEYDKETAPIKAARKIVDDKYTPVLKKADLALKSAKEALKPWLIAEKKRLELEAKAAQVRADEAAFDAAHERAGAADDDLGAQLRASDAVDEAIKADHIATGAAKKRANIQTDNRALGLRTAWRAEMLQDEENTPAALDWAMCAHYDMMVEFVTQLANKAVRSGFRSIPGFRVYEDTTVA